MDKELQHKFINNALRIEIINKLIVDSIENNIKVDPEYIVDLKKSLEDHIQYLESLRPL